MKKIIFGALVLSVLASACKKSDDSSTPSNTFYVNGTAHTANTVARQAQLNALQAVETSGSSTSQVLIRFKTLPTASGTYRVVNAADSANELDITYQSSANALYDSNNSSVNATVTVDNGKITVSIPDVYLKNLGTTDSVKFSATLGE